MRRARTPISRASTRASRSGERIIVHGRVLEADGRPVRDTLIEIWQCNSGGRYRHEGDRHPAPLDPNFTGLGRCLTDAEGRYRFVTIKPGAYPWRNHDNAWRPAHIHFSLFGRAFTQRLVTQMYFPGDPLFGQDPIFNSVRDPAARERMVSAFDLDATEPEWALAYRWDIVLRGPAGHAARRGGRRMSRGTTPSQTVGPFFAIGLPWEDGPFVVPDGHRGRDRIRGRVLDGAGEPVPDALVETWQADPDGRFDHPDDPRGRAPAGFRGFGRCPTGADGALGDRHAQARRRAGGRRRPQAPHVAVSLFARGLLNRVVTRIYFGDEAEANAADPVLALLDEDARAHADRDAGGGRLRDRLPPPGRRETAFFRA